MTLKKPYVLEELDNLNNHVNTIDEQLADIVYNVKQFGAVGDGITDDTTAIKQAFEVSKNVYFPKGTYLINVPNVSRQALKWFTDINDITISGDNAYLIDGNTYSTPSMVNVFAFTRCKNIKIKGVYYKGKPIANPDTQLQNLGTTFVYFEDNCKNIEVDVDLENIRYGVRSGDYLEPSYGYCSNFKLNITGKMIGYPQALYLADNVKSNIDVDGVHRASYLAGVNHADIDVKTKNSYGATIQSLLTNSLTVYSENQSEQRARGCKDIKMRTSDTGSTVYLPHTALTGIGLQWVAQGTEFTDIDIHFNIRSSDSVASAIGGFHLDSTVTGVPFKFEPYIKFKNIKIGGTIDRIGQTIATNQAGEIFVRAYDTTDTSFEHCPEVSNFIVDNVVINKGVIQSRAIYLDVPNLKDCLLVRNLQADGIDINMSCKTGKILLENSKIKSVGVSSIVNELQIINSSVTSVATSLITKLTTSAFSLALTKSANVIRELIVTTTAGVNTYTVNTALKSTSLTKAIVGVLTGFVASGYLKLGTTENPTLYGSAPLNSSNGYTRFSPFYFNQATFPLYTSSPLVITLETATPIPSGLTIDLFVYEEEFIVN